MSALAFLILAGLSGFLAATTDNIEASMVLSLVTLVCIGAAIWSVFS